MTPSDRFWSKVSFPRGESGGCWEWTGAAGGGGYGHILVHGRLVKAHRFSWAMYRGDIPDAMYLDHVCRNRRCVRPDHLECVTPSVNTSRGTNSLRPRRTACKKGHRIEGDNAVTKIVSGQPWFTCGICFRADAVERNRRWRARKLDLSKLPLVPGAA